MIFTRSQYEDLTAPQVGPSPLKTPAEADFLDTEEFYNVMQVYRWAPDKISTGSEEITASEAFEAVKDYIRLKLWITL